MNTFKLRTHCPEGHDLRVHGGLMMGMLRCKECHAEAMRKKFKDKPMAVWAPGWKKRRKAGSHE